MNEFAKTKQSGETLEEMRGTERRRVVTGALTTRGPRRLSVSHTHTPTHGGGLTWPLKRPTLGAGCVRRVPAARSPRRRSSSCTWRGSSSADAASTTIAPSESCDCAEKGRLTTAVTAVLISSQLRLVANLTCFGRYICSLGP